MGFKGGFQRRHGEGTAPAMGEPSAERPSGTTRGGDNRERQADVPWGHGVDANYPVRKDGANVAQQHNPGHVVDG